MKLDILCFGAHPDDVELAMAGTVIQHKRKGYAVGIVDLTRGEMGSRGTAETRKVEAAEATQRMGIDIRENLELPDVFFQNDKESQLAVIRMIRKYKPDVVFCNAPSDRHPDHGKGSELVVQAAFMSGLLKIETELDGVSQEKWRPRKVYHYVQDRYLRPDFVVDISEVYEERMHAIAAYETQFFNPAMTGPRTPISSEEFQMFLKGRSAEFGRMINAKFGEGFISAVPVGVDDVLVLK